MKLRMRNPGTMSLAFAAALLLAAVLLPGIAAREAQAQVAPSSSLKTVPVPEPVNLARFVKDKEAAIRLGKALFWDMQLGSDGLMACASCHFHAGTDGRVKNTLRSGANGVFDVAGPNGTLTTADFPFHQMVNPDDRGTGGLDPDDPDVRRSFDDVVGAQGVPRTQLVGIVEGQAVDRGRILRDTPFTSNGRNVRQVTGRNSPTVINAVFNFANFFDGRANHNFNGVNPFGVQDARPSTRVWLNSGGTLTPLSLVNADDPANQLDNASLASQAVGPPGDSTEMSWVGRSWPEIGRKMLSLRPLAKQAVHPQDSRLSPLRHSSGQGLTTTYSAMIQESFVDGFWNGAGTVTGGFTQMEANFSLFFGLAVQLYEATLVSDDTPFDRFAEGNLAALSPSALRGLNLFLSGGIGCFNCHVGAEFTSATVSMARNPEEPGVVETMNMGDGRAATYDIGFYNIGVTPTAADLGRGGNDPFGNPLSFSRQRQIVNAGGELTFDERFVPDQGCVPDLLGNPPLVCPPDLSVITRVAANGSFKTPTLRNVELTGPYMHNGGMATLMQVVDFYTRGGNFHEANIDDLDPFIVDLNGLKGNEADQRALVDFLLALTDERVRQESAPFDHPQLFVAEGHVSSIPGNPKRTRLLADNLREIPAVGAPGRAAQGLPPLRPFLNDSGDPEFHYQP